MNDSREEHQQVVQKKKPALPYRIAQPVRRAVQQYGFIAACVLFALAVGVLILNPPSYNAYRYVAGWLPGGPSTASKGAADTVSSRTAIRDQARLFLQTEPSGATVQVGSLFEDTTPVTNRVVPAGAHRIVIRKDGYATFDSVLVLRRDQSSFVQATLQTEQVASNTQSGGSDEGRSVQAIEAANVDGTNARERRADRRERPIDEAALPSPTVTVSDASADAPPADASSEERLRRDEAAASGAEPGPTRTADAVTTGTLRITSQPEGASVRIGGQSIGTTPLALDERPAGPHRVVLEADGYASATETVTVRPGQARDVEAELTPLTGQLSVHVEPWGAIYIGEQLHQSEADVRYTTELPVGEHRLVVEHPALGRWEQVVTVQPGTSDSITVNFNEPVPGPAQADTSFAPRTKR